MALSPSLETAFTQAANDRSALIPLLQQVQGELGYVSEAAVDILSHQLRVSTSEIFGVLTFYAQFRLRPPGKHTVKVCRGTACHVRGAPTIIDAVEGELGLQGAADTTADGEFTFEKIACFGACSLAPVMVVDGDTRGRASPDTARRLIRRLKDKQAVAHAGAKEDKKDE